MVVSSYFGRRGHVADVNGEKLWRAEEQQVSDVLMRYGCAAVQTPLWTLQSFHVLL